MVVLAIVHQPIKHNAALSVLADVLGTLDVGLQEELAHCGVLTVKLDREVEIWIGVDQRQRPHQSSTSTKVLVVLEPPDVRDFCTVGFDLVLTFRQDYLDLLPCARLFVSATPWLLPAEWPTFHGPGKMCSVGFLRGSKTRTEGHRLRHEVWAAQGRLEEVTAVALEFEAGGNVGRDERNKQFSSLFVVVIENSRHSNYFTEKLLDALLARCVPIYWGCPNIGDFFDAGGMIQIDGGVDEIISVFSKLSMEDFMARAEACERNFDLARSYAGDFGQRIQRALEGCLPIHAPVVAADAQS